MAQKKLYPFSIRKHGHDLELVANRTYNLAQDALRAGDFNEYNRLTELNERAERICNAALYGSMDGCVAWLSGPDLAEARQMVLMAAGIRDGLALQYASR